MIMNFSFSDWLLLQEGVYDPQAFKAVIMLGGPGTGKSYLSDFFRGFKPVNSDSLFEKYMKGGRRVGPGSQDDQGGYVPPAQTGLAPTNQRFTQAMQTHTWTHDELPPGPGDERGYNLGQWKDRPMQGDIDVNDDELLRKMKKRASAYANAQSGIRRPPSMSQGNKGQYTGSTYAGFRREGPKRVDALGFEPHPFRGNPLILETTGQNLDCLEEDVPRLIALGYDVYGVMVNCLHIDSAIRSNSERSRRLRDGLVVTIHRGVQNKMPELAAGFQSEASGWFVISVDRTPPPDYEWLTSDQLSLAIDDPNGAWVPLKERIMAGKWGFSDVGPQIGKIVSKIQRAPLTNEIGLEYLRRERRKALEDPQVSDDPDSPTPGIPLDTTRTGAKRLPPWQGPEGTGPEGRNTRPV